MFLCFYFSRFGKPKPVAVGVKSDTFIPGLKEKVIEAFTHKQHIKQIITFVAKYIADDMAPFVIIIPTKKKTKKKSKK